MKLTPEVAAAVVSAAIEAGMYPHGKAVPEDDKTKVAHATESLELAGQFSRIVKIRGGDNVPNWGNVSKLIIAAGLDLEQVVEHGLPVEEDTPAAPQAPEPSSAPVATAPAPPPVEQAAVSAANPMDSLTKASDHEKPRVPIPGEIWESHDAPAGTAGAPQKQVMRIHSITPEGEIMVEIGKPGEPVPVPRAYLAKCTVEAPKPGEGDYDGPPPPQPVGRGNSMESQVSPQQYEYVPAVQPVESTIASVGLVTDPPQGTSIVVPQQEERKIAPFKDPFDQAMSIPSEPKPEITGITGIPAAPQPVVPEPVEQQVVEQPPQPTQPVAVEPPAEEVSPSPGPAFQSDLVPYAQVQTPAEKPDVPLFPEHNWDGDEKYKDLLAEVDERRNPAGMPIPQDLTRDLPLIPEDLSDVPDKEAQAFHSLYNALAARARFLHDLEADYARSCGHLRDHYWRLAVKGARAKLGKDATLEEVKIEAELDADVTKWRERRDKHQAEASAFKTFLDINSDNVKVLSRDWTMRDREQQNA